MQENEFEASIRKEMETLQLIPAEAVWKNVAASIQTEKRRRRFFVILFFFTLLAILGGWYFYNDSTHTLRALANPKEMSSTGISSTNNDKTFQATVNKADSGVTGLSDSTTISQPNIKKPVIEQTSFEQPWTHQSIKSSLKSQTVATTDQAEAKKINSKLAGDRNALIKSTLKADDKTVKIYKEPEPKLVATTGSQHQIIQPLPSEEQRPTVQGNLSKSALSNPSESARETKATVIADPKKDTASTSASAAKPIESIKAAPNKKWNLSFSIFTGISNNLSRFSLFSGTNTNYANASLSSISIGTGTVNSSLSKLTYKSSLSYALGGYLRKQTSKAIAFSAGINFHYVSATSLVGNRSNTTRTIYDSTLGNSLTINESYSNGQSVSYRNRYYLFELPFSMLIRLNKNQNKPILFTAGLAPAYLIGSNALYAGTYQNGYYINNDQFKKWLLTAQAGFQFTITNAPGFGVTIGPQIQYGFNNMAKSATSTNQHLFSGGLQANIHLK